MDDQAQQLQRFVAVAAHDLRSPLGTLRGFIDLLVETEELSEMGSYLVGRAIDVTERMHAVIDSLSEHAQAAGRALDPVSVDLDDAVEHAQIALAPLLEARGAQIDVGSLPRARCDLEATTLVLTHVMDNAVRYHAEGEPVTVTVRGSVEGGLAVLTVDDSGPGLPPGTEQEVFEPFVKTVNSRGHQTSGLGLATCRQLVERMGGTIEAENRDGGGLRVTVSLPAD